jgi:NAD(P)-dependent dehydrogenase (short-subunit alcohol dehydrogenase family)
MQKLFKGLKMGFSKTLLLNKKILITGAGKGIGRACALLAAECGANVIAVARTESDLRDLAAVYPNNITYWVADVSDELFLEKLKSLSSLDGLINNAGVNRVAPMLDQTSDNIDTVFDMNIKHVYKVTQAALPALLSSKNGSIVNMSSQMAFVGSPGRTLYCTSKHAIEGMTKSLAVELAEQHIRVNSVAPTFVETPMTKPMLEDPEFKKFVFDMIPMKKLANVNDVANSCIFLLSDLTQMITGTSIKIDGGWTAR